MSEPKKHNRYIIKSVPVSSLGVPKDWPGANELQFITDIDKTEICYCERGEDHHEVEA